MRLGAGRSITLVGVAVVFGVATYGAGSVLTEGASDPATDPATPSPRPVPLVEVQTPDGVIRVTGDMASEVPLGEYVKVGEINSNAYWTGPGATAGARCILSIGTVDGTLLGCNDGPVFARQGLAIVDPSSDGNRLEGAVIAPSGYTTGSVGGKAVALRGGAAIISVPTGSNAVELSGAGRPALTVPLPDPPS